MRLRASEVASCRMSRRTVTHAGVGKHVGAQCIDSSTDSAAHLWPQHRGQSGAIIFHWGLCHRPRTPTCVMPASVAHAAQPIGVPSRTIRTTELSEHQEIRRHIRKEARNPPSHPKVSKKSARTSERKQESDLSHCTDSLRSYPNVTPTRRRTKQKSDNRVTAAMARPHQRCRGARATDQAG